MNETEVKAKIEDNGIAIRSHAWPSGNRVSVAARPLEMVDLSLRNFRNEAEVHAIHSALAQTGWNRKRAAKLLSISYRCLLYKIRRHNITPAVEHG
jgi:DNA-binding NtrC family response regulator